MKCEYATASIAAMILATAVSGPAQADGYDPAALCASAAPTQAGLAAMLATIKAQTLAEIETAGGLSVQQQSQHETIMHGLDSVQQVSRHDVTFVGSASAVATHRIVDASTGDTYAGQVLGDRGDFKGQLALKELGQTEIWIKGKPAGDTARNLAQMIEDALDASDFDLLQASATDTAEHAFTCAVHEAPASSLTGVPQLVLTDAYTTSGGQGLSRTYTVEFTPAGGLSMLQNDQTANGGKAPEAGTATFAYPGRTIAVPVPITAKQWDAVVLRATFASWGAGSLKATRAKVKKISGRAARVAAVRKLAKSTAAGFFMPTSTKNVRDGITVTTARAKGSKATWWYTLKVAGAKVTMNSNLP